MTSLIAKLQEIFPTVTITAETEARIKHAVMSHMGNKGGRNKSPNKIKAVRDNLAKANLKRKERQNERKQN